MSTDLKDLGLLLDSKVPILVIESFEEPRVLEMLTRLAVSRASPLYTWSVTEGLCRLGFGSGIESEDSARDAEGVLRYVKSVAEPGIYVLCDFHPYLRDDALNIRLLRDIAMQHQRLGHTLIMLSHEISVPPEIRRYCARVELSMPTDEQLMSMVREEASNWARSRGNQPVRSTTRAFTQLVANLRGVSMQDARQLVRGAIYDDGAIDDSDIPDLNRAKFALMDMEGVLSFEYDTAQFTDVGGLHRLKAWLAERRLQFLEDTSPGLDPPKGIMLLGIQGSGKSLAAKAVAGLWGIPLLRLDFGSLYNKYYGETEKNLREALKLADMMSPCVLWLDEIEKGVSTRQDDSGIGQRVLGTLLTWMAERNSRAFIVATSNDMTQLPPELIRKGRLDEIFFVDLPGSAAREAIFRIHLDKRQQSADKFALSHLAEISEGFSGAEIEQAVVSALYSVAAREETLAMSHIEDALRSTNPLSVVMAEKIAALREWADTRCIFAD